MIGMSIKIAICDDEPEERHLLSQFIHKQNINCNITEYASPNEFLMGQKAYDLIFLDIGMTYADTELDGLALARKIRQEFDIQPMIIFVTGFEEYVYDAFDVEAFQYLLKPVNEERFAEVFKRAVQQIKKLQAEPKQQVIIAPYAGNKKMIPIASIHYIESYNHKIILHMEHEEIEYYAKISDLEQELAGQFYRCHKSYLVNLAYVDEYSKSEVTLINKIKLLISKYKYAEFVKAYLSFMQKED